MNNLRPYSLIMANRKIIVLSFVLFLAFGIMVESVMTGVCYCGRCFPKAIQDKADIQINSVLHKSYLGSICKNCRLKNGNSVKAIHFCNQSFNEKIFSAFITSGFGDFSSSGMSDRHETAETIGGFQNRPIYLQGLSFRC